MGILGSTTRIFGVLDIHILAAALAVASVVSLGNNSAQGSETVLHAFTEGGSDGGLPQGGLLSGDRGILYGTTGYGGMNGCGGGGACGTVFSLDPSTGVETVLHYFGSGTDGYWPYSGLIKDSAGDLYGTTLDGGPNGCGTVFKLAPDGTESVLYSFRGGDDGANPVGGLIADSVGNFYGTTSGGGNYHYPACKHSGCGIVFKLAPDGTETVLYRFTGRVDGALPNATVIMDEAGILYGTTVLGGPNDLGTAFKLTPDGTETVLSHFDEGRKGSNPRGSLIKEQRTGGLYGTATGGYGSSTVFEIAPNGKTRVLHTFAGNDGLYPQSQLLRDRAGNLYGTTAEGGTDNLGTIFKLAPDGTESVLYSFCFQINCIDGDTPIGGLTRGKDGNLYGTTQWGGDASCNNGVGCGTVFKLTN